jgi:hypothetical protein
VLRITSDTNVIVSALNFPGNPSRILDLAEAGDAHGAVSMGVISSVPKPLFGDANPDMNS